MIVRKSCAVALCFGLMALLGGQPSRAADSEQHQWTALKSKMRAEGWRQIAEGVFERQMGQTKVERMGYGRPGIAWTINDLNSRLRTLNERYEDSPSEDLAEAIDELSGLLARTSQDFQVMPQGLTSAMAAVTGGSCSNICYSATADAYPLTSTQGVGAVAQPCQ